VGEGERGRMGEWENGRVGEGGMEGLRDLVKEYRLGSKKKVLKG